MNVRSMGLIDLGAKWYVGVWVRRGVEVGPWQPQKDAAGARHLAEVCLSSPQEHILTTCMLLTDELLCYLSVLELSKVTLSL